MQRNLNKDYTAYFGILPSDGIYGTRNICLHAKRNEINNFYVSNMSTGWSRNLGFPMPEGWDFDQFTEYTHGGVDIDQVSSSGKDLGCKNFDVSEDISVNKVIHRFIKSVQMLNSLKDITFEMGKTYGPTVLPGIDAWLTVKDSWSVETGNLSSPFTIVNGKIESSFQNEIADVMKIKYGIINYLDIMGIVNRIAGNLQHGTLIMGVAIRAEEPGQIGMKITYNGPYTEGDKSNKISDTIEIYYKQPVVSPPYPEISYNYVYDIVSGLETVGAWLVIGSAVIMAVMFLASVPELLVADPAVSAFGLLVDTLPQE